MNQVIELPSRKLWRDFWTYFWRWLVLGALGGLSTPVTGGDFDAVKIAQLTEGVIYGILCAVIFTPLQNVLNPERIRWKTWCLIFGSSLLVKLTAIALFYAV